MPLDYTILEDAFDKHGLISLKGWDGIEREFEREAECILRELTDEPFLRYLEDCNTLDDIHGILTLRVGRSFDTKHERVERACRYICAKDTAHHFWRLPDHLNRGNKTPDSIKGQIVQTKEKDQPAVEPASPEQPRLL
jgi:hypothetical protein